MFARMCEYSGEEYAKRGFAFVYQYCRGIAGSEGIWEPNVHERDDGLSLMNWLQQQDWVESVGFMGASYLALTGWAMADAVPDKVKTMYLTVYGTKRHTSAWKDGLFRQDVLTSWSMGNTGHEVDADFIESALYMPHEEVDEAMWGGRLQWYRDLVTHPDFTHEYWQEGFWSTLMHVPEKLKIPIFVGEGWYDHHLGSALEGWEMLSDEAKAHSVLQICPGNHGLSPVIYGHPNAQNARVNSDLQAYHWFDTVLRKKQLPRPGVKVYMIGADEWLDCPVYPFTPKEHLSLYLSQEGMSLSPGQDGSRSYVYDPSVPIYTHGAESLLKSKDEHAGSLEQPEPNWRQDVISFVSEPFEQSVDICGRMLARLYVQTDAPDTCFAVKVMEVFEDGRAFHIRNGITTIKWNGGVKHDYDGGVRAVDIDMWDIVWRVTAGSRLRVDISSSNFPEYSVHPNTDELWSQATERRIAHQTVFFGESTPSCLVLPLQNHRDE